MTLARPARRPYCSLVALVAVVACGAEPATPLTTPAATAAAMTTAAVPLATPPSATVARPSSTPRPDTASIFARLRPGLVACYEAGKREVPAMLDGKLTLNGSVDASGRTTCAIPTDDSGLTQEVEDCMSARLTAEKFAPDTPWMATVPVIVRAGSVELGERTRATVSIDSVETHRMADAFEVLESLMTSLDGCTREVDTSAGVKSLIVAARIGTDGKTQCALATATSGALVASGGATREALPPKATACAVRVFLEAKFPPPKGGPGLILVPLTIVRH